MGLALALVLTWSAITVYHFAWNPLRRLSAQLRVGGLVYSPGPVVLIGDSLMAGLRAPCPGIINLATPGARVQDFDLTFVDALAARKPSRIIIMIGINDLRDPLEPKLLSQSIIAFAKQLRDRSPISYIMVLSILPIVDSDTPANAWNSKIREVNGYLQSGIPGDEIGFVNVAGLFGSASLMPRLTYDGIHLNARGEAILHSVIFDGLAGSGQRQAEACSK